MTRSAKPVGTITRGTTHPNRLRRIDRWIVDVLGPGLRRRDSPVVVDLGFGSSPITTIELQQRLAKAVPQALVVGLEIDPQRVSAAATAHPSGTFEVGGFELGRRAGGVSVVRACNVLRQYDESSVPQAWAQMLAACLPDGVVVEGTCDELGRLASWVRLDAAVAPSTPVSLTLSMRLAGLERPGAIAARLPKALIHHNAPGSRIHALLRALDDAWAAAAPLQAFGARQRWLATVAAVQREGFHVHGGPSRWRLGEITVAWSDVAP